MRARFLSALVCLLSSSSLAAPLVVNGANSPYTITTGVNDTWDSVSVESGGTLLINAEVHVTAGSFTVKSGGVVRTSPGTTMVFIDAGGQTVDVQFGGSIDLNGLGLLGGNQPGNGFGDRGQTLDPTTLLVVAGSTLHLGGSNGGRGGGASAATYGTQTGLPLRGGGGAGGSYSNLGGNGGGALRIVAATLRVDGNILANGNPGSSSYAGGGGAGGSLHAVVGTFTGGGALSAQGGSGPDYGGGGGRIYIDLSTHTFIGTLGLAGGTGAVAAGGLGTAYLRSTAGVQYVRGGAVDFGSGDTAVSAVFQQGGTLRLNGPAAITNPVVVPSGSTLELNAGTALASATLVSPIDGALVVNVPVTRAGDLVLNGTLLLNAQLSIGGSLTISPTCVVTHAAANRNAYLNVTSTLDLQGTVNLDGKGCPRGWTFDGPTRICVAGATLYAGGSYGGLGGRSAGPMVGSQDAPAELGSSGGDGSYSYAGGAGGGFIRIQAGTLSLDGLLTANGLAGATSYDPGGGAGGGVRIDATTFQGAGSLRANGGFASGNGGSGAGGRVSINYTSSTFTGTVSAVGAGGTNPGADGTVRLRSAANALTVVNGRYDLTTSSSFASVTLAGNAWVTASGTPTVTQQLTVGSTNQLSLESIDALTNLTFNPTVAGTLVVNAPFTLPALTVPGALTLNAATTTGALTASGTVLVNAPLTAPTLTLNSGALMSHAAGVGTMAVNVAGTMTIGTGATLNMNGKGLGISQTYDPVTLQRITYGQGQVGGSHGGLGGGSPAVATYDSNSQPLLLGAGGGWGSYSYQGGLGGGRVRITADTLQLDGSISANGTNGSSSYSAGGGAGGSVWLTLTTFRGAGNIYANGGGGSGGGGGGGRISVQYLTSTHSGFISAAGGAGSSNGAVGSVYVQSTAAAPDVVVSTGEYRIAGGQTFNSITLKSGAVLQVDGPATVTQPLVLAAGSAVWLNTTDATANLTLPTTLDGTLVVNAPSTLARPTVVNGTLWVRYPLQLQASLDARGTALLRLDELLNVTGDVLMASGARADHSAQWNKFDLRLTGRLLVSVGAVVNVDGLGFPGGNAGAFGINGTTVDTATFSGKQGSAANAGGSFGGLGGLAGANPVYGSPTQVTFLGSGGGGGSYGYVGGNGGGLVRITAGVIDLFGQVRANGTAGTSYSAGGGSGGGVQLVTVAFNGSGAVRANGGNAPGGGGGGGRIHIEAANNTFTGTIETLAGTGSTGGAVGTIDTTATTAAPVIFSTPATFAKVNTAWAYDADGLPQAAGSNPISWSLVSGPPGATVNASTGAFTWTPSSLGRSAFVLRATNAVGSNDQGFSVDVLAPPQVTSSGASSGQLNAPYHYNASDTLVVTGSQPLTFTATVAPPGAPAFEVDQAGKVTWTPNSQGTYSPCVRVENPVGATDHCFTVTVSAAVTPPAITSSPPTGGSVGLPYSYQALATGSAPMTFAFLAGAAPTGATVTSTGQVQWTPSTPGSAFFCLRASNAGGADTQCWEVLVTPTPESPRIASTCAPLATVGQPYHYDADDAVDVSGTLPITFSLVGAPAGMGIDAAGKLTWTPAAPGPVTFNVRADNSAGSFTQTCLVTVRSTMPSAGAPLILRLANPVAAVGLPYLYDVGGKLRADGQKPITWSKTAGPGNFHVDSGSGAVTWKPNAVGVQSVTVKASNALGDDSYTFTVDVKAAAPSGPKAGIAGGGTIGGPAPFTSTVDGSDTTSSARIVSWHWSFGDGSPDAEGQTATHTWTACGGYVVRLTVTDEFGQSSTAEQMVVVDCNGLVPPAARIVMSQRTGQGSLAANFSADITPGSGAIHGQQWLATDGFSSDLAADTHAFGPGTHTLQLLVVDSNGLTAVDRVQVFVTDASGNEPPRVMVWASPPTSPAPATVQFGQEAFDPDGALASGTWTFLDGNTSAEAAPSKSYPEATFDRATYTVADDKGLTASAFVEVHVTSASGDAPPEIISTPRTSIFAGQLYTYDKDGMPTVRGSGPFSFALAVKPEGATVDAATGLVQWTPAANLEGSFDFTLEVTGKTGRATQAWKVEVVRLGAGGAAPGPASGCSCGAVDAGAAWLAALALARLLSRRRARR